MKAFAFAIFIFFLSSGIAYGQSETNVKGGVPSQQGRIPSAVAVSTTKRLCGGVLIAQRWVILVEHCIEGIEENEAIKLEIGGVKRGITEPGEVVVYSRDFYTYTGPIQDKNGPVDLLLVRIPPVRFSEYISVTKFYTSTSVATESIPVQLFGFGTDGTGIPNTILRYADTYMNCVQLEEQEHNLSCKPFIMPTQMTCIGDSGSGVMIDPYTPNQRLLGLVKEGTSCEEFNDFSRNVFLLVSYFQDWIESTMAANSKNVIYLPVMSSS